MSQSSLPEVIPGETYRLHLIMDNGGTSVASQTWDPDNGYFKCIAFEFNDARDAVLVQDLSPL